MIKIVTDEEHVIKRTKDGHTAVIFDCGRVVFTGNIAEVVFEEQDEDDGLLSSPVVWEPIGAGAGQADREPDRAAVAGATAPVAAPAPIPTRQASPAPAAPITHPTAPHGPPPPAVPFLTNDDAVGIVVDETRLNLPDYVASLPFDVIMKLKLDVSFLKEVAIKIAAKSKEDKTAVMTARALYARAAGKDIDPTDVGAAFQQDLRPARIMQNVDHVFESTPSTIRKDWGSTERVSTQLRDANGKFASPQPRLPYGRK